MNQFCTIGRSYPAIINTENRNSPLPTTEYTIYYSLSGDVRQVKISACSSFKALRLFRELNEDVYKHSKILKVV